MEILIAEDDVVAAELLASTLEEAGHKVAAVAANGREAIEFLRKSRCNVIISDWEMPEMNGVQLCQAIRSGELGRYVYVILLTVREGTSHIVEGLSAGADDFLAKPFDPNELRVRLNAGARIIQLERRLASQNEMLQAANDRMKRDLEAAARVQQTLLPGELPDTEGLSFAWAYRPCDELAGDALNVFRINDRLLGLYVLDVSGHGVPAALLSVTATRSLSPSAGLSPAIGSGPDPDAVSPAQVASRLNALYPMESNGDHYFTLVYGLLDVQTKELRFICAGHPGPVLARPGQPQRRFDAPALPIGIIEGAEYEDTLIKLCPGDRLYIHSDGVTEEMDAEGAEFGDECLLGAIADSRDMTLPESVDSLVRKVIDWRGDGHLRDDVSILAIEVA